MAVTTQQLTQWKQQGRTIVALTAWDYAIAQLLDVAGVDLILVGDSLAVILGYETTLPLTLDEMIHHAKAVRRGVKNALVVVDLPFLTYQESISQAMHSAGRVLKETGAQAVKLEGGYPAMVETITRLVQVGIPVMGHVGLIPQSIHQLGLRQQGKTPEAGERIFNEAIALEQAHAQQQSQRHIPTTGPQDAGVGFDRPQVCLNLRQTSLIHQVRLIQQEDVAVDHLGTGDRAVQGRRAEVFGIDQGDDRIQA